MADLAQEGRTRHDIEFFRLEPVRPTVDFRIRFPPLSAAVTDMAKFANILETVGNTPVVKVGKLAPAGINLYVKIEAFNPLGSVKDRLALGVIEDAERRGTLKPGQTVVEATSGNTGIGLAMVCAQKGYPLVVTMAESFSVERRKLMRFLGAKVVLTPAPAGGTGMVAKAVELAKTHGWFLTRQFENEANADFHSRTTAREIVERLRGRAAGLLGDRLRHRRHAQGRRPRAAKERPETRIVLAEPADAPHRVERHAAGAKPGRIAGRPAPGLEAAPDSGLESGFHPQARGRRGGGRAGPPGDHGADARSDAMEPAARGEGRDLRRHLGGRHVRRGLAGGGERAKGHRPSSACCPIPASGISRRRCSPISRRT